MRYQRTWCSRWYHWPWFFTPFYAHTLCYDTLQFLPLKGRKCICSPLEFGPVEWDKSIIVMPESGSEAVCSCLPAYASDVVIALSPRINTHGAELSQPRSTEPSQLTQKSKKCLKPKGWNGFVLISCGNSYLYEGMGTTMWEEMKFQCG